MNCKNTTVQQYDSMLLLYVVCLWMCVLLIPLLYICVCVYLPIQGPLRECRSIQPGASRLTYYCAPLVSVPAVLGLLAVWQHNKAKTKNRWHLHLCAFQGWGSWRANCVDLKPKKNWKCSSGKGYLSEIGNWHNPEFQWEDSWYNPDSGLYHESWDTPQKSWVSTFLQSREAKFGGNYLHNTYSRGIF